MLIQHLVHLHTNTHTHIQTISNTQHFYQNYFPACIYIAM